jgi:hypothetical protein
MNKPLLIATALIGLVTVNVKAQEQQTFRAVYRITNTDTVVTRYHRDLASLMELNAQGRGTDVRALYNQLAALQSLVLLQPGDVVRVAHYYTDHTAQIVFSDQQAYIAQVDLTLCYQGKQ